MRTDQHSPTGNGAGTLRVPSAGLTMRRLSGFTLVELLVVITIIAILVALLVVAAAGAMKRARFTRIKVEVDQISMAFETYAQETSGGDYPPNTMTDSNNTSNPVNFVVLNDFRRHFKRAFPNSKEPVDLLEALVGMNVAPSFPNFTANLPGGMTAAEALVFWMGGFSDDVKYPISGVGGPSYLIDTSSGSLDPNAQDPIEERKWVIPLKIDQLVPRNDEGYFADVSTGGDGRFIEYPDPRQPPGSGVRRRINLWRYNGPNSNQPIVYFDASRHQPVQRDSSGNLVVSYDPPLDGAQSNSVFALKILATTSGKAALRFANDDKFQILHSGIDDDWGEMTRLSANAFVNAPATFLAYPDGPFTGALADTITNFAPGTLEDSQP